MGFMFAYSAASSLDLSSFNTSNIRDMSRMFESSKATTLNLSSFNTNKVTDMSRMFQAATNLKTIYASDKFVTTNVTKSSAMFRYCESLVGGNGTVYNSSNTGKTYARIDTASTPGYFTLK